MSLNDDNAGWIGDDGKIHYPIKTIKEQSCLHDGCVECHGKGIKKDGSICIHWISCPCPKCTPRF
jgi:hypothetical protein